MVSAAVTQSLRTRREEEERAAGLASAGAGSSKSRAPTNKAAALAAAAASRRLARELQQNSDPEFEFEDVMSLSDDSGDLSGEDSEPLAKGKGKGKGKQAVKVRAQTKFMTVAELRRQKRLERARGRSATSKEEAEMRKRLGRKLTHVSVLTSDSCVNGVDGLCRLRNLPLRCTNFTQT